MIRKLFAHTFIYGAAPHIPKIASFFVLPIITQYLTPLDYGVYGVVTATTGAISVLASLGLRVVLVNSFYKSTSHYTWVWRQVYGFLSIWIFPYAIFSGILLYLIIPDEAAGQVWEILLLNIVPALVFGQVSTLATTYYQVNKKPIPIAVRTIVFGILAVVLNWVMIAKLKLGYMGWFWSSAIVTMMVNVSYWWPLNVIFKITPIFNFKWRLIKNCLKISLPTVPHYYAGYLVNASDKMIMELVNINASNIGRYNVAYTFGNYFNNLGNASGLAVGPWLNECYKRGDERTARDLIFLLQIVFMASSFIVSIWLKELFQFFIRNDELNQMFDLGVIIVMSYTYRPMYLGANARVFYTEQTSVLWRVSFIAGVINVVMNLITLPILGFEAAAFTTFVSLMYMGYSGYYLRAFKTHSQLTYYPLLWLGLTVLVTLAAYGVVHLSWQTKAVSTFVLCPLVIFVILKLKNKINNGIGART